MIGTELLVDTNIFIYTLNGDKILGSVLQDCRNLYSGITKLELLGTSRLSEEELNIVASFISPFKELDITSPIIGHSIFLRKKYGLKSPDAIICATALDYNLHLLTSDKQLDKISEIESIIY